MDQVTPQVIARKVAGASSSQSSKKSWADEIDSVVPVEVNFLDSAPARLSPMNPVSMDSVKEVKDDSKDFLDPDSNDPVEEIKDAILDSDSLDPVKEAKDANAEKG
ncbi:uncharacterized protein A4U43_C07F11090 [Asparagus officinalis]|uniref:Uncharacterized protein n=1 Tax=Asparagus officinalis TaxID=4686 RepID=A0A5P1EE27_ASPOF|nr:uncharacterized protein A4U43_C07F11090 [Asparagus officinalis]